MTDGSAPNQESAKALEGLLEEVVQLFYRLRMIAEQLHGDGEFSGPMRTAILTLARHGMLSAAELARFQLGSVMFTVDTLNELSKRGMVEVLLSDQESGNVQFRLTPDGLTQAREMQRREALLLKRADCSLSPSELMQTTATLRSMRRMFEGPKFSGKAVKNVVNPVRLKSK